ncbi:MAG: hypothetical protein AVDCRST_MAG67-4260 [uncultured Solirubrobacteraceae bacterium]|uniref:Uncharacterized protein n=1 Tax=uncultured Solirubrobacteraceae bacterium TaxID=1162706 RepID=A0A6J4TPD1_9ACTN|nr:MAG: hypothetical protein AVDCRST_MAG67-4260 [uncultured Solirubrobacteraceae bacterium]
MRELLTRRRLGGAALVLAGLAVAGVVLWPALDRDDPAPARAAPAVRLVSIPELGLTFAHPRSWKRSVKGRVLFLRSPRRAAIMTFASVGGRRPKQVKALLLRTLRGRMDPVSVVRDGPGRLGPRSATTFELTGLTPAGIERALGLVASTAYRTYAITLVTPARPSRRRLLEATQILASVRLAKPLASKP